MSLFCNQCPALKESFLCDLDHESRDIIRSQGIIIHYNTGQDIIKQGVPSEGCFCLRKGQVRVSLDTRHGESLTMKLYSNCGVIGAQAITGIRNMYTATCLSECDICFFPRGALLNFMASHPSIGPRLNQIILDNFIQLSKVTVSLVSRSVPQRVAEALVTLQQLFCNDRRNIPSMITREEIARLAGTSVESVFRALSEFKKRKYIEVEGKKIRLLNEERLKSFAKIK